MIGEYEFVKKQYSLSIFLVIGIILCLYRISKGFFPIPLGIRHFIHMTFKPKAILKPIIKEPFQFNKKGFMAEYELNPKNLDIYDLGIIFDGEGIRSNYTFNGKIKIELLSKNKLIEESLVSKIVTAIYADKESRFYKKVSLYKFGVPFKNKYIKDLKIRLTVIEPDMELNKFSTIASIFVGISGTP